MAQPVSTSPNESEESPLAEQSMNEYYVYLMASHVKTLHTGVIRDLIRRVFQHKSGKGGRFTAKYGVDRLVFYESIPT